LAGTEDRAVQNRSVWAGRRVIHSPWLHSRQPRWELLAQAAPDLRGIGPARRPDGRGTWPARSVV